ncbi:Hypothetical_protein [Hexamita inflata]|uniref:Hypothetical_protein n=1 Tax=Hexamita inflata TaxID=28002 RepID=A0ABP1LU77_9EUKA
MSKITKIPLTVGTTFDSKQSTSTSHTSLYQLDFQSPPQILSKIIRQSDAQNIVYYNASVIKQFRDQKFDDYNNSAMYNLGNADNQTTNQEGERDEEQIFDRRQEYPILQTESKYKQEVADQPLYEDSEGFQVVQKQPSNLQNMIRNEVEYLKSMVERMKNIEHWAEQCTANVAKLEKNQQKQQRKVMSQMQ